MVGPEGTCYDGGLFQAVISFPADYPLSPPKMRFTSEMWHPNVHEDGKVWCVVFFNPWQCYYLGSRALRASISILHTAGDAITATYEDASEQWSPVQSLEKVLLSVVSMLAEPNDESPANVDAAKQWREDRKGFVARAQRTVRKSLNYE